MATATAVTSLFGVLNAPAATADPSTDAGVRGLGSQATVVNGDVVQGWTVSDLKPSTDTIAYPVRGTLWEAVATDEAINGSVIPIVSNLNARTAGGQSYRALFMVASPQGVNPATLAQGGKTTGKVYFDVTGEDPNSVVYNDGRQDLASWLPSTPPQWRSGGSAVTRPAYSPATPLSHVALPAPPGQPAPVSGPAPSAQPPSAGGAAIPALAANQVAPTDTSRGTPLPAGLPAPTSAEPAAVPPAAAGVQPAATAVTAAATPTPGQVVAQPIPGDTSRGTPLPGDVPAPVSPAPTEPAAVPPATAAATPTPGQVVAQPIPGDTSRGTPLPGGIPAPPSPATYPVPPVAAAYPTPPAGALDVVPGSSVVPTVAGAAVSSGSPAAG